MTRIRSAAILIHENKILLMHRINEGYEYYAFPGGGQEEGETTEETVVRELAEETTIDARPVRLLYTINWDNGDKNYFYECEYLSGEPVLHPDSEELEEMKDGSQVYEPMWIPLEQIADLRLYQLEIRDLLIEDLKTDFSNTPRTMFIKVEDRRR